MKQLSKEEEFEFLIGHDSGGFYSKQANYALLFIIIAVSLIIVGVLWFVIHNVFGFFVIK